MDTRHALHIVGKTKMNTVAKMYFQPFFYGNFAFYGERYQDGHAEVVSGEISWKTLQHGFEKDILSLFIRIHMDEICGMNPAGQINLNHKTVKRLAKGDINAQKVLIETLLWSWEDLEGYNIQRA